MRAVYEFHGCFWHGCPKCSSKNTKNPVNGSLMSDLYQQTLDKQVFIQNEGFDYISIKECDFMKQCNIKKMTY